MQCCKSVNLRSRDKRNGLKSLFLEFYPGYRDPETMELRRRRALGMYIYAQPQTAAEKEYNRQIMEKAETIRSQVYVEVLNERYGFFSKDRMKESFLPYFEEQLGKSNTKSMSSYKHFVKFCGGSCSFEELDLPLCRKFMEYLLHARDLKNKKRFISQNSAAAYWNVFRNVLATTYREKRIKENINETLENISYVPTTKESLTLNEVRALYNTPCKYDVLRKAAVFSCMCGLRISDILNLKWENVRTYADGGLYLDFICVKTKRQTIVPISKEAYKLILPKKTEKVFEGLKRNMTFKEMSSWMEQAGIKKHITFHGFRHTYASLQLELGSDIFTVQHLLNHRNVATTQIYVAHADPKTREAASRITLTDVKRGRRSK
jgi:integrase